MRIGTLGSALSLCLAVSAWSLCPTSSGLYFLQLLCPWEAVLLSGRMLQGQCQLWSLEHVEPVLSSLWWWAGDPHPNPPMRASYTCSWWTELPWTPSGPRVLLQPGMPW